MKRSTQVSLLLFFLLLAGHCQRNAAPQVQLFSPDHPHIHYIGRIDVSDPKHPKLSGAGAYFRIHFQGRSCELIMNDQHLNGNHNYIAIELDGQYQGRLKISRDRNKYVVADKLKDGDHLLFICKATEAQNGYIELSGIRCEQLLPLKGEPRRKIEFIGNSITCGMGVDTTEIPCGAGTWYDQHNAYLAYGPLVARALQADWLLSAVSGIGVSRNWNSPGPTMPEVYPNLYLNTDSIVTWAAERYVPDLISICLGTNDFSDGDGSYQRADLDSATFVRGYIQFVQSIRDRYPDAPICCVSSPAISRQKAVRLNNYLSAVVQHFKKRQAAEKISLFIFSRTYSGGCSGHPNRPEHQQMAEELLPYYRQVMGW